MRPRQGPLWSHGVEVRSNYNQELGSIFSVKITFPNLEQSVALVDTGSQISIIRQDLLSGITKEPISLKSVNRRSLFILGVGMLNFKIESETFDHKFIVVKDVKHPLLLGMDFIKKIIKIMDIHRNILEFHEKEDTQLDCVSTEQVECGDNLKENEKEIDHAYIQEEAVEVKLDEPLVGNYPMIAIADFLVNKSHLKICLSACPVDDAVFLKAHLNKPELFPY